MIFYKYNFTGCLCDPDMGKNTDILMNTVENLKIYNLSPKDVVKIGIDIIMKNVEPKIFYYAHFAKIEIVEIILGKK